MGVESMFGGNPSPTVIASDELRSASFVNGVNLKTELPCISNTLLTNPLALSCSNMGVTEKLQDAEFQQDVAALFQSAPVNSSNGACMGSSSHDPRTGMQGSTQSDNYSGHNNGDFTNQAPVTVGERRDRKNFKERKRRQTMKDKFEELTTILYKSRSAQGTNDFGSEEKKWQKMKKMDVLSEAILAIKDLQEEVQTLKVERYRYASLLGHSMMGKPLPQAQGSSQTGMANHQNHQGLLRVSGGMHAGGMHAGGMHAHGMASNTAQPMLMSGTS